MKEYRIHGPPGTGKSRYIMERVGEAVERWGPTKVMVTSFTKAAAQELIARNTSCSRDMIGTLHAHCYRILGRPTIMEADMSGWNSANPTLSVKGGNANPDDPYSDHATESTGDQLLQEMNSLRSRMIHRNLWGTRVEAFARKWYDYKEQTGTVDFTDLLERCLMTVSIHPENPSVCYLDEAQDSVPLELALIRKWAANMDHFILAFDDDQMLYSFRGAVPEALIGHAIPDEQKKYLGQTHRLPRAVFEAAEKWVRRLSYREPKVYQPKPEEGKVIRCGLNLNDPDSVLNNMKAHLDAGKRVMLLTSCGYMLNRLVHALREKGIPYANPYRPNRGDWNPLAGRGTRAADRILDLLRPSVKVYGADARMWTGKEFRRVVEVIESEENLLDGAKAALERLPDELEVTIENILATFPEHTATRLMGLMDESPEAAVEWYLKKILPSKRKAFEFPARIGIEGLKREPAVVVGTIHSVKGGEADVVYLFPDLSRLGMIEWIGSRRQQDNVVRQFYVGMTRAKETLYLCEASQKFNVGGL